MRRAKHSLSHFRLATFNQGVLYPCACLEVLPGDSIRQATAALIRVSPLVAPVMHPVFVAIHHWFVPNRLVWGNFEKFMTDMNATMTVPTVNCSTGPAISAMANSFGIGVDQGISLLVNALPFRAYNLIYNEFYRDQDLVSPLVVEQGDGTDPSANYALRNVSWEKDYFTLARPTPQQGSVAAVSIDFNSATLPVTSPPGVPVGYKNADGTGNTLGLTSSPSATTVGWNVAQGATGSVKSTGIVSGLAADVSASTATMDINEWRNAMYQQRIKEHRSRYGSRYTDYLRFLGINPSDARLQRPEYLGGGKQTISFSEVLATAEGTNTNVGDMSGHGIAAVRSRTYKRFFEEHGWILSLISVRPKTIYQQQCPRKFLRRTVNDYWQKESEMLGEQPVGNSEIFANSALPTGVFGYVQRHDDYRHHESSVSGEFRTTLDYWHMARKFTVAPALNGAFVTADPTNRIYASTNTDQLMVMINHHISARRLVSKVARNG